MLFTLDKIESSPPRATLHDLRELLQTLAEAPDAPRTGACVAQCVFCRAVFTRHFGRRSGLHFFRHPGSAPILFSRDCNLSGAAFWGDDEEEARNAINA